jgi:hypothetical protein
VHVCGNVCVCACVCVELVLPAGHGTQHECIPTHLSYSLLRNCKHLILQGSPRQGPVILKSTTAFHDVGSQSIFGTGISCWQLTPAGRHWLTAQPNRVPSVQCRREKHRGVRVDKCSDIMHPPFVVKHIASLFPLTPSPLSLHAAQLLPIQLLGLHYPCCSSTSARSQTTQSLVCQVARVGSFPTQTQGPPHQKPKWVANEGVVYVSSRPVPPRPARCAT